MKVITFLRHSKSSWDYEILDIHRPLSAVGIEKIKKTANSSKDHFIFICRDEHLLNKDLDLRNYLNNIAPNTTVLNVENHKLGPVHSILQIHQYIDDDDELLFFFFGVSEPRERHG